MDESVGRQSGNDGKHGGNEHGAEHLISTLPAKRGLVGLFGNVHGQTASADAIN
jgi:hypothetical protein